MTAAIPAVAHMNGRKVLYGKKNELAKIPEARIIPNPNTLSSLSFLISLLNRLPKRRPDTREYPPSETWRNTVSQSRLNPSHEKSNPRLTAATLRFNIIHKEKKKKVVSRDTAPTIALKADSINSPPKSRPPDLSNCCSSERPTSSSSRRKETLAGPIKDALQTSVNLSLYGNPNGMTDPPLLDRVVSTRTKSKGVPTDWPGFAQHSISLRCREGRSNEVLSVTAGIKS